MPAFGPSEVHVLLNKTGDALFEQCPPPKEATFFPEQLSGSLFICVLEKNILGQYLFRDKVTGFLGVSYEPDKTSFKPDPASQESFSARVVSSFLWRKPGTQRSRT